MKSIRIASSVLLASALLLFLDLFLDWQQTTVSLPLVNVEAGSSGWHGWGIAAGIAVAALLVWEGIRLRLEQTPQQLLIGAALAILVAAFTLGAFFGGAEVTSGGVTVTVAGHHWPAWAGLVLALLVAGSALTRLVVALAAHAPRPHAGAV